MGTVQSRLISVAARARLAGRLSGWGHLGSRHLLLVLPAAYVAVFLVVPLALTLVWSLWERDGFWMRPALSPAAYITFFSGPRLTVLERTVVLASVVTALGLLIAYPIAYLVSMKLPPALARLVLLLLTIPFLVNYILRDVSLTYVLDRVGPVNALLLRSGVVHQPVDWLLYSPFAVAVGLISSYMPFMIYPIWLALSGIDRRLLEASWLLGARPLRTFLQVTLPLSMPGVFAGLMFAFVGSFGDSATARILGGSGFQMMGDTITSALGVLNYPLAAATSTTVVAMMLVLLVIWFLLFDASSLLGKVATWRRQE